MGCLLLRSSSDILHRYFIAVMVALVFRDRNQPRMNRQQRTTISPTARWRGQRDILRTASAYQVNNITSGLISNFASISTNLASTERYSFRDRGPLAPFP